MKYIITLTRMQLGSALDFMNFRHKKNKKKHMSAFAILAFSFLLFSFLSFSYSYSMGITMKMLGALDVLPGLLMAVTCLITLMTSIYKVKGTLFGFKDYDIIMSLPVKTGTVVASRLLLLYIINIFFTVVIMVPGFIVYGYLARPLLLYYFLGAISIFFVPLIPIIIASIIGTVLAAISSRFKHSNAVNIVFTMLLVFFIFIASFGIQSDQQLIDIGKTIKEQMNQIYPLAHLYLQGIIEYNIVSYILFLLISLIAFALFSIIVGKYFKKMNSSIMAKRVSASFKFKEEKQQSALKALYKKELKRYFSSGVYIMNTAFGPLMLLIGAIGLFFYKPEQVKAMLEMEEARTMLQNSMPIVIAFFVTSLSITASSISLEGKNLWIIKSAPIRVSDWFLSKMMVSFTVTVPTILIGGTLMCIHVRANAVQLLWTLALPLAYCYLTAVLGLLINLKFPVFDWTNETVVIKQSAASMIGTFAPMLTVALPVVVLMFVKSINVNLLYFLTFLIVVGVSGMLHRNLNKRGNEILIKL